MLPPKSWLLVPFLACLAILSNAEYSGMVGCGNGASKTNYLQVSDIKKNVYRIEKHKEFMSSVCYTEKSETKCELQLYWLNQRRPTTCYVSMARMQKEKDYPLETIISSLFAEQKQETSAHVSSSQDPSAHVSSSQGASAQISSSQDTSALISTPQIKFFKLNEMTAVSLEIKATRFLCDGSTLYAFYPNIKRTKLYDASNTATCNSTLKAFLAETAAQENASKDKIAEDLKRRSKEEFALTAFKQGRSVQDTEQWAEYLKSVGVEIFN